MARVFKPTYPKPIPADAEIISRDGKPHARFRRRNKFTVAPLTEDRKRILLETKKWYVEIRDSDGILRKVPGYTDKASTEQLAARLEKRVAQKAEGLLDPFEEHRKRPLADHLADFRAALEIKGNTSDYISLVLGRLQGLMSGCEWKTLNDLSASQADEWLARQRVSGEPSAMLPADKETFTPGETAELLGVSLSAIRGAVKRHALQAIGQGKARCFPRATVQALLIRQGQGTSAQTRNYYRTHLRTFGNWLVKGRRLGENPFRHMEAENTKVDRRHDRRELTVDELRHLLAVTRASERMFRGLNGLDRFVLYSTACGTGFRARALASLTPESFDLDGETPVVALAAKKNKNRKPKVQPIPAELVEMLRHYLKSKSAREPVWGGTWAEDHRGAEMLRADLEAAGIPYAIEGPDGPLFADFHSLRHTYLTLLGRGGVDLRTQQELADHSSPLLTARYSHRRLYDLDGGVNKLPAFLPEETRTETLRATGTDGQHVVQHVGLSNMLSHPAPSVCTDDQLMHGELDSTQIQKRKPVSAHLHQPASPCTSEGDGTRTRNHRIDSPVL